MMNQRMVRWNTRNHTVMVTKWDGKSVSRHTYYLSHKGCPSEMRMAAITEKAENTDGACVIRGNDQCNYIHWNKEG